MEEQKPGKPESEVFELQKQHPALRGLLNALGAARKQSCLYGDDHPNAHEAIAALVGSLETFISCFDQATCVFTKKSVIVNQHHFTCSTDSQEMLRRLRARGVMAITFVAEPSIEQVTAFLEFLNAEPREIRRQGGPSAYLRRHGISRIVATESMYGGWDDTDDDESESDQAERDSDLADPAIAAVIGWLCKETESDGLDRLSIAEILSHPDMAAKLIREAVTKLHASRKRQTAGESASTIIHDLKDLAAADAEKWDNAAPEIRKAVSSLPREVRPAAGVFMSDGETSDGPIADYDEVEAAVAGILEQQPTSEAGGLPSPSHFDHLFGARASGLLSSWKKELHPSSVIASCGRTLETLMIWESSANEHGSIARALAWLIPCALDMRDMESATIFAESLTEEASRASVPTWRGANAKEALRSLDTSTLKELVERAMKTGDYHAKGVAAALVEALPVLATSLMDFLGAYDSEPFGESLKRGIVKAGQAASGRLGRCLREGSAAARESALEALINMGAAHAIREIATALGGAHPDLAVKALGMLPQVRIPITFETCVKALSHRSQVVRCAALNALGEFGDTSAAPYLVHVLARRLLWRDDTAERIAAIDALGQLDRGEALPLLIKLANHRPIFSRSRYEGIRAAAEQAAERIYFRQAESAAKAA